MAMAQGILTLTLTQEPFPERPAANANGPVSNGPVPPPFLFLLFPRQIVRKAEEIGGFCHGFRFSWRFGILH